MGARQQKSTSVRFAALVLACCLPLATYAAVSPEGAVCGTCWANPNAACIIGGIMTDNSCDAATPSCKQPM